MPDTINQILTYEQNLPATIEELVPYVLIGEEKIKAYRTKVAVMDLLGMEVVEAKTP